MAEPLAAETSTWSNNRTVVPAIGIIAAAVVFGTLTFYSYPACPPAHAGAKTFDSTAMIGFPFPFMGKSGWAGRLAFWPGLLIDTTCIVLGGFILESISRLYRRKSNINTQ